MDVYDDTNPLRTHCIDTIRFNGNIINTTDHDIDTYPISLIVSVIAVSNEINVNEKVKIIANIVNNNYENETDYLIVFKWTEINGLLSYNEIIKYKQSTTKSLNL
eukprot:220393_1